MSYFFGAVVVAGVSLAFPNQVQAVTILQSEEATFDGSSVDALQGRLSIKSPPGSPTTAEPDGQVREDKYAYLTDGLENITIFSAGDNDPSSAPGGGNGSHDNLLNFVTYDLGAFDSSRYLERVDIWVAGNTINDRRNFYGFLETSNDNVTFTLIPKTEYQTTFTVLSGAFGSRGLVSYNFDQNDVGAFRYLRFNSDASRGEANTAQNLQPRITEIDGFFAPVPEPGVAALSIVAGMAFFGCRRRRH